MSSTNTLTNGKREDEITRVTPSSDDDEIDIWVVSKRSKISSTNGKNAEKGEKCTRDELQKDQLVEKFKHLKERHRAMKDRSDHLRAKNLSRKAKKAARRAMREPGKELEGSLETSRSSSAISNDVETEWNQTDLERKIDDAVEKGNVEEAEKLSDQLTSRNFAVKVNEAFNAKKYDEKRSIEKEEENAKRQKTLHWGFEAKQRWEMKSNL